MDKTETQISYCNSIISNNLSKQTLDTKMKSIVLIKILAENFRNNKKMKMSLLRRITLDGKIYFEIIDLIKFLKIFTSIDYENIILKVLNKYKINIYTFFCIRSKIIFLLWYTFNLLFYFEKCLNK